MSNEKENHVTCAFCGGPMVWDADFMSEEYGYEVEGKLVAEYTCSQCGATATFVENLEEENDSSDNINMAGDLHIGS